MSNYDKQDFNDFRQRNNRMGYTLMDSIYFDGIKLFSDELSRADTKYAIVGGCGTQIWLAKAIAGRRAINRSEEALCAILRPTKDIDIISYENAAFDEFINRMPYLVDPESGLEIHVGPNKIDLKRGNDRITLQYISETSGLSEIYSYIVNEAREVSLTKGSVLFHPCVARPEHIVTAKLTQERNNEKHYKDIFDLVYNFQRSGMDFNDEEVRSLLKTLNKSERMDVLAHIRQSFQ